MRHRRDFTQGVAVTSSVHPDDTTHIEPVRYGKGSNAMGLLGTLMTDGSGRNPRWLRWIATVVRHPGQLVSIYLGINHLSAPQARRDRPRHRERAEATHR